MTTVEEQQNSPRALQLLAAQRWTYSRAKVYRGVRVAASAGLAIAAPIVALWSAPASVYLAATGGIVAVLAQLLGQPHEKKLARRAAHIQDQFDSLVFGLVPRRDPDVIDEETAAAAEACRNKASLTGWYTTSDRLPYEVMSLLAQRSNLVWNVRQRKQYAVLVGVLLGLLLTIDVLVGRSTPMETWLVSLFIPSLPGFTYGFEVIRDHVVARTQEGHALEEVEKLWQAAKRDPTALTRNALRGVQDFLLRLRAEHTSVPDWVHRLLRSSFETNAREALNLRVEDFEKAQGITSRPASGLPSLAPPAASTNPIPLALAAKLP